MLHAWPDCSMRFRAWSSTGFLLASPALRYWRVLREFALLNGGDTAIEENWNDERFTSFVDRGPRGGVGAGDHSRRGPAGRRTGSLARRHRGRRGNPGDEKCPRHVW